MSCLSITGKAMPSALDRTLTNLPRSAALVAAAVFLLLDLGCRLAYPGWHPDRFTSPNRSWAWWAVQDLRRQGRTPDLVIMGSSLMLSVVNDGDATYLQRPEDAVYHHRSRYLEDLLRKNYQADVRTFSLAIGGQMASDAYALVSTLFAGGGRPKVIVYGIAPRDFIDSMCSDPASTETFRFMARAGNPELSAALARRTLWGRADAALRAACFMYDKRIDLVACEQQAARAVCGLLAARAADTGKTLEALRFTSKLAAGEEAAPGEFISRPYKAATFKYTDNLAEYRLRYSVFNARMYATEIAYLEKLLKYGRDAGINVVLVNMPLTRENMEIMPPGIYHRYLADVSGAARACGACFEDLNQPGLFSHDDFADSVHVNGRGAERLLDILCAKLAERSQVAFRP